MKEKEAEERQQLLDTRHYHFYEVAPIPQTTKTEVIDHEVTIEPRDPYDLYLYFEKHKVKAFYVKEEAFDCSTALEDLKEKEKERQKKKGKKDLSVLPTQPIPLQEKVAMPMGKIGAPEKKEKKLLKVLMCAMFVEQTMSTLLTSTVT